MYNQDPLTINNNNNDNDKIEISDETRIYIIDKLVEPYYKNIIKNTIDGRLCWRKTGIAFETISKIMVAFGSILSFSAGYYHDDTLSFISGSISCLSLAFLQLSSFSYKENKKQSEELNILLKKLKLDTIPVFERQADTQMRQYQSSRQAPMSNYNPTYTYNPTYNPIYNPPYKSYNSYDPSNLHDKNNDYSYNQTLNHYIPPSHNSIPNRSMPSISPSRISSIHSSHSLEPEPEAEAEPEPEPEAMQYTTEDIININKFLDEYKKKENSKKINLEHIPEQIIDTQENKLQTETEAETEAEIEAEIETEIETETEAQTETEVIDNNESNLFQKTVKFLFN